jgi:hypothetical protein
MPNKTSQHILGSSANLLGFCLLVLTSLHITNTAEKSVLDELTSVIALLLTASSALSFVALRSKKETMQFRLENIAEYLFIISLIGIFIVILFIMIRYWSI